MMLEDIVDVFEKMCQTPIQDDTILFETGTYSFTGDPFFYFSLVRQFPNEEGEYHQIHVDILYKPSHENKSFFNTVWKEELDENIFDYIRKSKVFAYAKRDKIIKVEIYMDET